MYVEHLLGARSHRDKHSMVVFIGFYLDKMDADLGALGTLVCWNVLIEGDAMCIDVDPCP